MQRWKPGFIRKINWSEHWSKVLIEGQNPYLDFQINPYFQVVNRLFVLSFEINADGTSYTWYFFPIVEIKAENVMIKGKKVFDQPIKNDGRIYHNIQKFINYHRDDYRTKCLLDYVYLKNYCKMIAIDLIE